MNIEGVRRYLTSVRLRPTEPSPENVKEFLAMAKAESVGCGDQNRAKAIWCLETAVRIQDLYLQAFSEMKDQRFYEAWCDLERAEIALGFLERHDRACWPEFRLDFIQKHIERWQSIFPYKLFCSPERITLKKTCSICGKTVSPRRPCGHIKGEIYDGEQCVLHIEEAELIGMSYVEKPFQKYSVLFLGDPKTGKPYDHYDYGIVQYALSALQDPFDGWDVVHTKRILPHSRFSYVGRNDRCPCGSGRKYKKCCGPGEGVLCHHEEFHFEVPPPPGIPAEGLLAAH